MIIGKGGLIWLQKAKAWMMISKRVRVVERPCTELTYVDDVDHVCDECLQDHFTYCDECGEGMVIWNGEENREDGRV